MALTQGDKDTIRVIASEIAVEIGEKVAEALRRNVEQMIALHQATCPAGRGVVASKWVLVGIGVALMLLTAGGSALGDLLMRLW